MYLLKSRKIQAILGLMTFLMLLALIFAPNKEKVVKKEVVQEKKVVEKIVEKKPVVEKKPAVIQARGSLTFGNSIDRTEKKAKTAEDNLGNVTVLKNYSTDNIENTPDSLAKKITDDRLVEWQPKLRYSNLGGVLLPAIDLSEDQSVLAIVELFGGKDNFYGSKIIFINTYNWRVLKIKSFVDKKISNIKFLGNSNKMILTCENQSIRETNQTEIISYNIINDIMQSLSIKDEIIDFCTSNNGRQIFLTTTGKELYTIHSTDLSFQIKDIFSANAKLAVPLQSNDLLAVGDKVIKLLNPFTNSTRLTYKLPDNFKVQNISFINNNNFSLIVTGKNGRSIFYKESVENKALSDLATGKVIDASLLLSTDKDAEPVKVIIVEEIKNKKLSIYSYSELVKIDELIPDKIKEKARKKIKHGNALFIEYLKHSKNIVVMDKFGTLYILYKDGRRWKKKVILSQLK